MIPKSLNRSCVIWRRPGKFQFENLKIESESEKSGKLNLRRHARHEVHTVNSVKCVEGTSSYEKSSPDAN